jgi:hypothetical protein
MQQAGETLKKGKTPTAGEGVVATKRGKGVEEHQKKKNRKASTP